MNQWSPTHKFRTIYNVLDIVLFITAGNLTIIYCKGFEIKLFFRTINMINIQIRLEAKLEEGQSSY